MSILHRKEQNRTDVIFILEKFILWSFLHIYSRKNIARGMLNKVTLSRETALLIIGFFFPESLIREVEPQFEIVRVE